MSLKSIEFYNYDDQLMAHFKKSDTHVKVTEKERKTIITPVIAMMELDYPEALEALQKEYKKSAMYRDYYEYRIVNRFLRCNYGEIDNKLDIDADGGYNFERVSCPLRGDCKLENVVCNPTLNTKISLSEMRVITLWYKGMSISDIADMLSLSEHTCRNHTRNAMTRLGLHGKAELFKYIAGNKSILI